MNKSTFSYKKIIISAFFVVGIIAVVFFLIYGLLNGYLQNFIDKFVDIISPITIGFVIAYFSNPVVMFFEKKLFFKIKRFGVRRLLSIILTFILAFILIIFVMTMLIPNLIDTIQSFWDAYIVNYESATKLLAMRINMMMDKFAFFDSMQRIDPDKLIDTIHTSFPWIDSLVEGDFSAIFPNSSDSFTDNASGIDISVILKSDNFLALFGYVLSFGSSIFNIVKNFLLGIFISIYMLLSKEKTKAHLRRFLNSFLSPRKVRFIVRFGNLLDRSFGGFIEGQLLDALIVGIICYILFLIFGFANPHLLATIIAVTNVIPVLGPFLGGIPGAFLVLLIQPEKTILFILLILVVQQIDGNIICPNILGDKINISTLATLIAIVVMGGLFGIFGMLIGVPVFAVAIHLINNYTINALRRKGFETSLSHYYVGNTDDIAERKSGNQNNKILSSISAITSKLLSKKEKAHKKEKK